MVLHLLSAEFCSKMSTMGMSPQSRFSLKLRVDKAATELIQPKTLQVWELSRVPGCTNHPLLPIHAPPGKCDLRLGETRRCLVVGKDRDF